VVGIVVPPYRFGTVTPGDGAVVSTYGLDTVFPSQQTTFASVILDYTSEADPATVRQALEGVGWRFDTKSDQPPPPGAVANLLQTPPILAWLGGFFVVTAIVAVVVAAARRGRQHRRETSVLRSIGFTSRDDLVATTVEALVLGAIQVIVGIAVGVVAGRAAWRLATRDLGVVDAPSSLLVPIIGFLVLVAVVVAVSALVTWRLAVSARPAEVLRAG
jgi:predicted lysophospholipase L1 biosynthesis ABC-type transport system permease subunit